jgi:hypothetical protein
VTKELIIELRGLIALVSDRSTNPSRVHVLFPNATNPSAGWIPDLLHFQQRHLPRLLLRHGRKHSSSDVSTVNLYRCEGQKQETRSGVLLERRHVALTDLTTQGLTVDRTDVTGLDPNQPGTNRTSLGYVADMEALAQLTEPILGGVSAALLDPEYPTIDPRLIARLELQAGELVTGAIWRRAGAYPRVPFQPYPATVGFPVYEAYLAKWILLKADFADTVTFHLHPQIDSTQTAEKLVLEADPDGPYPDRLQVIVENGAETQCDHDDYHYLAHYLLRDGWEQLTKQSGARVRMPDDWGGVNDNPQCSPTDHQG